MISIPQDPLADTALAQAMDEGYRAEADSPSLDEDWAKIETEGQ